MASIHFFTSICFELITETAGPYFYLGGRRAHVIAGRVENGKQAIDLSKGTSSFLISVLKVAAYFAIILPLVLLILKIALRYKNRFQLVPPSICEHLQEEREILDHGRKPLLVEVKTLGLNLAEEMEIRVKAPVRNETDHDPSLEWSLRSLTMEEFANAVITEINKQIFESKEEDPAKGKRAISLKVLRDFALGYGESGVSSNNEVVKLLWLDRIIDGLVAKGDLKRGSIGYKSSFG